MALPPLVPVDALRERATYTYDDAELGRAEAVLIDASNLVRAEAGNNWVDANGVPNPPPVIETIVLRVAQRAMDNPEGLSSATMPEYAWRKEGVEDGVYLSDKECRIVRRTAGKSGLWTQPLTRDGNDSDTVWVDDSFGAEPFPLYAADDIVQ